MPEKKIIIGADTSSAESNFERMASKVSSSMGKIGDSASKAGKKIDESIDKAASKMEELDKDTSELFKDIVKDAEKYGKTTKERSAFIEKEIKLLERLNREEAQRAKIAAKMAYESKTGKLGSSYQDKLKEQAAHKDYLKQVSDIESRSQMADLQHRILKGKHEDKEAEDRERGEDRGGDGDPSRTGVGGGKVVNVANRGVGVGRTAVNAAAGALGFGAMLSLAGFIGKTLDEAIQLETQQSRAGAMGLSSGHVGGLKSADAIAYSKNIALSAGYGNVRNLATQQGLIERRTGMELGSMDSFHKSFRAEKEEGKTLIDASLEMVSLLKQQTDYFGENGKDMTMMHELLERQNSLNEMQLGQTEEMSSKSSIQLMAAFGKVGGSFGDHRQVDTLGSINQGITDPNNDFKKAFIMRSIKKRKPDASLLDVSMAQEEGIFGEGVFSGLMEDLTKTFSGEQLTFSISKMFNLKLGQALSLQNAYGADPSRFANISSQADIDKTVSAGNIGNGGGVSTVEGWQAGFNDWAAGLGSKGIDYIESLKSAYDEGGVGGLASKVLGDIGTVIKNAFLEAGKFLYEGFSGEKEANEKLDEFDKKQLSYEDKSSEQEKLVNAMAKELGVDTNDPIAMRVVKSEAFKLTHADRKQYLGSVGLVGNEVHGTGTWIDKNYTSEDYMKDFSKGGVRGVGVGGVTEKDRLKRRLKETKLLMEEIGWGKQTKEEIEAMSPEERKIFEDKAILMKNQMEGYKDVYGDMKLEKADITFGSKDERLLRVLESIEKNGSKSNEMNDKSKKENYSTYSEN